MNYLLVIENQQAVIESLREQLADCKKQNVMLRGYLEQLACLGNGDQHGNSIGNDIAIKALAATADLDGLILCHAEPCRDDGRCQYAIDHGAEGLGHCPEGKCCMPLYRAWEQTK
jgi:hypothetical protein